MAKRYLTLAKRPSVSQAPHCQGKSSGRVSMKKEKEAREEQNKLQSWKSL